MFSVEHITTTFFSTLTVRYEYGYIAFVKTTIDIPDAIYRQVKAKCAIEGRAIREVAIELFAGWLDGTASGGEIGRAPGGAAVQESRPAWFASLGAYAANANGRYDMASVRRSIAHGRRHKETPR